MSNPDDLKCCFRGPLWHWDGRPLQAQGTLKLTQSLMITQVYSIDHLTWAGPIMATPCCSSAYTHGTYCGLWAFIEWYCHFSFSFLLPTISSIFMTPETISFGRGHSCWLGGEHTYQGRARDHRHYWSPARWTTQDWVLNSSATEV